MLEGVSMVHLRDVRPAPDQTVGLRLVAFADRLYDSAIPVVVSGEPLPTLFTEEMLNGGYRKKYLRAISRLTALARDAAKVGQE
jgi:cell division protein ZapE